MKHDFAVIGANGIQGKIVSRFLLEDGYSVMLCAKDDYNMDELINHPKAEFALIDLRKMHPVKRAVKKSGATVVVNCAVDDFNLFVTKMALELGVNYLDLGSEEAMLKEQMSLDVEFKTKGILGISGVGSTPGITNVMLRHVKPKFDAIDTVHVGFAWDSNLPKFVTPFSIDAIEWEFTQKSKNLEGGAYIDRNPSECGVDYYYKSIGKQKAQYALHVEPVTFCEFLKDKGVKNIARIASYPSHSLSVIKTLIELGFMKREDVSFNGVSMRPIDFTAEILRRIPVPEGYAEKENLFVKIFGKKNGRNQTIEMDCVAGTLAGWEDATCNVDTGFPAAIAAEMIFKNEISAKGFTVPEFAIEPEPFFHELGKRKIWIYEDGKKINGSDGNGLDKTIKEKIEEFKPMSPVLAVKK